VTLIAIAEGEPHTTSGASVGVRSGFLRQSHSLSGAFLLLHSAPFAPFYARIDFMHSMGFSYRQYAMCW
jgi:hypothetical protein